VTSEESQAIVRTIVDLARSLNIATTAEGVETLHQMEAAKLLGCTEMQGYFFERARPAEEVPWLLSRQDRRVA
jgi:EAL domain-containing protein (putative c-di-GMP-specific phosphodiesterase class I)